MVRLVRLAKSWGGRAGSIHFFQSVRGLLFIRASLKPRMDRTLAARYFAPEDVFINTHFLLH